MPKFTFIRRRVAPVLLLATLLLAAVPAFAQLLLFKQVLERPQRPLPNLKVAYGDDPNQYGELWLPKTAPPHKVVLMIHGGCWLGSLPGPELLAFQADALRAAGFAVWSISYRRVDQPGGGYPGTFLDVAQGTDKLRQLAGPHALDLSRVVATGHSAGGHLALWAAARANIAEGSAVKTPEPLPIQAVVSVAGVPDLAYASQAQLCDGSVDRLANPLLDKKATAAVKWKDISPMELLPSHVRQTMVHGIYDSIVPPIHGYRYKLKASGLGDSVDILNLDESGHFELIAPWTVPGRQVVQRIVEAFNTP